MESLTRDYKKRRRSEGAEIGEVRDGGEIGVEVGEGEREEA